MNAVSPCIQLCHKQHQLLASRKGCLHKVKGMLQCLAGLIKQLLITVAVRAETFPQKRKTFVPVCDAALSKLHQIFFQLCAYRTAGAKPGAG